MGIYQISPDDVSELLGLEIPADFYYSRFQRIEHCLMNSKTREFVCLMRAYAKGMKYFISELNQQYNIYKKMLLPVINVKIKTKEAILLAILNEDENNSTYTEMQASAALISLKAKHDELIRDSDTLFYDECFYGKINAFSDLCFDIKVFFTSHANRRFQAIPGLELFPIAKDLVNYDISNSISLAPTSIFLIRQAIETHFLQSFGLEKLELMREERSSPIPFSNVLGCFKTLFKKKKICLCVNIYIVDKIYRWTNRYIHTGQFCYPYWYLSLIIDYLNEFFMESQEMYHLYNKKICSLVESIYVEKDYNENLYDNIKMELQNYLKMEVKITPLPKRNLITVSQEEMKEIQLCIKRKSCAIDFSEF